MLDSFAVIALLRDEPAGTEVAALLTGGDVTLTATGVAETLDHLVRLLGLDEEDAALDLAQLGLLDPPSLDSETAIRAGLLRSRHYHRRHRAVSLADCVAAETARATGPLATADPHLLQLCAAEAVDTVVLPDSRGRRWSKE